MAHNPQQGAFDRVDQDTVDSVARLVREFILPHAFEFYRTNETADRLRRLASWILTSRHDRIVASDLTRNIADLRGLTLLELNDRVSPLVAGGWLTPADRTPACRSWTVTAQVRDQFVERTRQEEARKAAVAELMGSPRRRTPSESRLSRNAT
jgi:hypothetical protein